MKVFRYSKVTVKSDYFEEVYIAFFKRGVNGIAGDEVWIFVGDLFSLGFYLLDGIICGLM